MALARVQYTQQVAGNKNFTVPFPYISRDHIFVSVNGGEDVGFSWLNDTTVQLTTAPAEGDVIDIRRETEKVNLLVDFQDASTITEEQLDLSAKQAFFIAQEAFDATGGTMAVANDGSYSANNRRISNLGDPDSDDDAANVRWVKAQYQSGKDAHQERLAAEAARDAADASKVAAANSEANALSYRNTANSHRIAAENSATAAAASETASAASAAAAKASEDDVAANAAAAQSAATAAANSEANALSYKNSAASSSSAAGSYATSANDSRAKASLWAEAAEDSAVEPGKFSAKHHAAKAAASSASASMSATNAANYRDTANSHRLAAANSAAEAANSETAALNHRNTADSHRIAAAGSAAEAAGYAAGLNLPSAIGNGGKVLRQKTDESGFEYIFGQETGSHLHGVGIWESGSWSSSGTHNTITILTNIPKRAVMPKVVIEATLGSYTNVARIDLSWYWYPTTASVYSPKAIVNAAGLYAHSIGVQVGIVNNLHAIYLTVPSSYIPRLTAYVTNIGDNYAPTFEESSGWSCQFDGVVPSERVSSAVNVVYHTGNAPNSVIQAKTVTSSNARYAISNVANAVNIPGLSIPFAPLFSDSLILLQAMVSTTATYVSSFGFARDGSALASSSSNNSNVTNGLVTRYDGSNTYGRIHVVSLMQGVTAGHTDTRTYTVQAANSWTGSSGTLYINDRSNNDMRSRSTFTIMEIRQ